MIRFIVSWRIAVAIGLGAGTAGAGEPAPRWQRDNVQAWCIVPFDAKKRSSEERAEMLQAIGLRRYAYDYRPEHIATFDREIEVMKQRGIEITAWWFPQKVDDTAKLIFAAIKRHAIKPALWISGGGPPAKTPEEQTARVAAEAARIRPIAEVARSLGCPIALYNHGGWFGDPENQLAVIEALRRDGIADVGLVYNFHHAHEHVRMFATLWPRISARVVAVNLSGVVENGDRTDRKIMYLGEGDQELAMLRIIRASGWRGQVGILCHRTDVDAESALRRNLAGYDELIAQIEAQPAARKK
ncbi:MAG: TIM barrel protein [Opitutaceae bacterium]|nr:TIM barrel protein [Opitutaceae bacterium]